MSAADDLVTLFGGRRPAGGVLQNCRMEAGGGDFYGEEAILERCRAVPVELVVAVPVSGPRGIALFGDGVAVVADLYGERIGRIWVVGATGPAEPEPAVAVPFDPDLAQARGGVSVDAADHPDVDEALLDRLASTGMRLVEEASADGPAYRVRAFLIRAWGEGSRGAGLFALHRLGPGPVRTSGFGYAAVLVDGAEEHIVRDGADRTTA
ncbi:hypothetical protein [Sphingomonas lenta]|uniref:Uncharacterized protein n=1 Tax=Sphingomonas lenta TaxID=1141887 RepID=A0A2A2SEN9_9SPHN|nr:hypothetical protein [Sphingomonas lenta]PAX07726.1 hypothetical protein CKY28_08795 [Sphingomonas lenta]